MAISFSSALNVNIVSSTEIVKASVLKVKAEDFIFSFINVYKPNQGSGRIEVFKILNKKTGGVYCYGLETGTVALILF